MEAKSIDSLPEKIWYFVLHSTIFRLIFVLKIIKDEISKAKYQSKILTSPPGGNRLFKCCPEN